MLKRMSIVVCIFVVLISSTVNAATTFDQTRNMWLSKLAWRDTQTKVVFAIWAQEENGFVSLCGNFHIRSYATDTNIRPWLKRSLDTSRVSIGNNTTSWDVNFLTEVSDQSLFGTQVSCLQTDIVWQNGINQSLRIRINGNRLLRK